MRRKWTLGLIALAAAGATAFAATGVFGGTSSAPDRPAYATVGVDLSARHSAAARPSAGPAKRGEPQVIYLQGPISTIDVARTGPNVDVRLLKCPGNSRVIDGGVFPGDPNVFQQGSYVPTRKEYHVLLGFRAGAPVQSFTITSHLICLKGVG